MECKKCGQEMTIDRETEQGYVWVCTNKQCEKYMKGETETGKTETVTIKENK